MGQVGLGWDAVYTQHGLMFGGTARRLRATCAETYFLLPVHIPWCLHTCFSLSFRVLAYPLLHMHLPSCLFKFYIRCTGCLAIFPAKG